ncbi:MAG: hypothetical protein WCF54_06820, partial [Terracidiphilus sp.]
MPRFTVSLLLLSLLSCPVAGFCQTPAQALPVQDHPAQDQPGQAFQPLPSEVAEAEAAISNSNWSVAEAKLSPWLAAHPTDARALFDAAYVADAQNRLEEAAALY